MKLRSDSSQRRERIWKIPLIIYFIAVIASSIAAIISLWNPVEAPIISAPNNIPASSNNTPNSDDTQLTVTIPTEGDQDVDDWRTNREKNLIIVNTLFGILGGSTYGLASITTWIGNNKYERSWTLWYVSRPIIGGALALIFYFLLRAGLVGGFPINVGDFGFAAISIIIGLLTTTAMKKLRDVFDVLFGIAKRKDEMGDEPTPAANASLKLGASTTKIKTGEELEIRATASDIDGTYAQGSSNFKIENTAIAIFTSQNVDAGTEDNIAVNFQNGIATARLKGVSKGKTDVIAASKIDVKDLTDKLTIEVTDIESNA
jgi:hypothetical protein